MKRLIYKVVVFLISFSLMFGQLGLVQADNLTGEVSEGWIQSGSTWSYSKSDGTMQIGWLQTSGKWYYLDSDGVMVTGWDLISDKWYYLNANGDMAMGWDLLGGKWYYLNSDGDMATGWKQIGKDWYYLNPISGAMVVSTTIGGYYLGGTGAMQDKPDAKLLIENIKGKGDAKQAIVVTTNGFATVNATITTFEQVGETWRQVASYAGNVGRNGFAYNKVEGDGHSPIGIFSLGTAFGIYSNPGTAMNYKKSSTNDFWVDDPNSLLYNTWQTGPASGRWASAESMYIPSYNYGFVINYNTSERIAGKGSAIFFHVWSGAGHGTAGCTATAQNNVISILRWLNPSKNPVLIEAPMSEVIKM